MASRNRKFTKAIKEQFVERLERGGDVTSVCKAIGISRDTFYRHLDQDAAFKERVNDARERANEHVQNALFGEATRPIRADFECKNCRTPNTVTLPGGNVTAMIFWLKCRGGWNDKAAEMQDMVPISVFQDFLDRVFEKIDLHVRDNATKRSLVSALVRSASPEVGTRKGQLH